MQAGDYNQRFAIAKVRYSVDENGRQMPDPETVYAGYAKVNNLSGREFWDAMAIDRQDTLRFYTRWDRRLKDLDCADHVILWDGKELDITSIDNVAHGNAQCIIKAQVRS